MANNHVIIKKKAFSLKTNLILIFMVIAIMAAPLLILKDAEFGGADAKAEEAIMEIKGDYKPWFSPILEPKSSEVESLLFALQAGIGAGVIGYVLGYFRGRKRTLDTEKENDKH